MNRRTEARWLPVAGLVAGMVILANLFTLRAVPVLAPLAFLRAGDLLLTLTFVAAAVVGILIGMLSKGLSTSLLAASLSVAVGGLISALILGLPAILGLAESSAVYLTAFRQSAASVLVALPAALLGAFAGDLIR